MGGKREEVLDRDKRGRRDLAVNLPRDRTRYNKIGDDDASALADAVRAMCYS